MHGFALNMATKLDHFSMIVPCGIDDRGVTSMEMEKLEQLERSEVENRIMNHFANVFDARVEMLERNDAKAFLEVYLDA